MRGSLEEVVLTLDGIRLTKDDIPLLEGIVSGQLTPPDKFSAVEDPHFFASDALLRLRMMDLIARYGAKPEVTVDGVLILTEEECRGLGHPVKGNGFVAVKRGKAPFVGQYALPGGFVEYGETTEAAVVREFLEETGLEVEVKELLGVYSSPDRDPRWHHISAVYLLSYRGGVLRGGDDAAEAVLLPLSPLPDLAFDHTKIIGDVIRRLSKTDE